MSDNCSRCNVSRLTDAAPSVRARDRRPLPLQVFDELRTRIHAGEYDPGTRLPPEAELAATFGVSRVTVREALRMLQQDGLVAPRHGRGHFVLGGAPIREPITELRSVTELLHSLGYSVETETLAVRTVPAGDVAAALALASDEPVLRVERVRRSAGDALIYSIDVLPARLLPEPSLDFGGSLLETLAERGIDIGHSSASMRATLLPRAVARRIGVPPSSPWLLLEQLNLDVNQHPVIWSLDYHRGDRFEFNVVRRRVRV